jgi:release factor glutamine methyltransferase
MRKLIKRFASLFLIPLTQWYLKKERTFKYKNLTIRVLPGVFHPGLFYSTRFLLEYLSELALAGKTLLELGCGSGIISITASQAGAIVTSSDLSGRALENTALNASQNTVTLNLINSDLFDHIIGRYDYIIINPPYYAKHPVTEAELAWHCGENFEYFEKLFRQLPRHVHTSSYVVMVLTRGCDIKTIFNIANRNGITPKLIREKTVLFDGRDYLYSLKVNSFV